VEIIHQETGGMALPRLRDGLAPPLRGVLSDVLASSERDASIDLGPAIELLLGVDGVLCGGSGVVTTRIAASLASRVLSQSVGLVVAGDVVTTLQHLRAPFEHPFLDVSLHYLARRAPGGFTLELNILHEPRAARWLASAGLGYAKAATQFSGDGALRRRLFSEVKGTVARVLGRHTDSGVVLLPSPSTATPMPSAMHGAASGRELGRDARSQRRRSGPTNAAERVDQILSRAPGRALPSEPPPRAQSGTRPVAARQTSAPRELATSAAPPSGLASTQGPGAPRPIVPARAEPFDSARARKSARS
jgi:hypothetical protein